MSEQPVINAYLEGRIGPWVLYRRLVRVGVSVSTALTLAVGLPAVVRGEQTLEELAARANQTSRHDLTELQRLLQMVGNALVPARESANLNPLAVSLAKLGVNVAVAMDDRVELKLEGAVGNRPLNLAGNLANLGEQDGFRNMNLVLNGDLGTLPVNLAGNVDAPLGDGPGINVNLGDANLTFLGAIGNVPLNFSGNIGNVADAD
jgi:hypothetical protein